ncbi:tumor protein D52 isoform X1 [Gadus macrocephalus]|uniref:tumor protein D52 isoform X1 n=1 Tax=Gadus macrocephalus TaxID=80720 RepID=UPI0028CB5FDF|nr:tumor protein D52 isoform X1 [Gadus macrocephalus]
MEPLEDYHSPFNFEQGVNASYMYLSPEYGDTPPGSPASRTRGQQMLSDPQPEVGEDAVSSMGPAPPALVPSLSPEEQEALQGELAKVEDEILTLSQVLTAKEKELAEIKKKLGITPLNELKQNFSRSWQEVTTSNAYRRTSESFSLAGLKASAALSTMGSAISRKLEDVNIRSLQHSASMPVMRNKPTFRSFEEKVGTLKTKMSPSGTLSNHDNQDGSAGLDPEPLFSQPNELPNQEPPTH